ncbi:MAG: EAL domain-containing protein [Candidatus Magnetominusculus sp. LBB02]|nr:EAL domain-containing protein [Candidatus Magnetominusculus sp. LBB02]
MEGKDNRLLSPTACFIFTAAAILVAEYLIMVLLDVFAIRSYVAIIDTATLSPIVTPVLYYSIVHPLQKRISMVDGLNRFLTSQLSNRKQEEGDLRNLTFALEQSISAIIITDIAGNIEFVNNKFTDITGYTFDEVRGKTPRILKSGKHPPEFYKHMWDTITVGDEFRADLCNKRKDGTFYWELLSISAIKDAAGNITHFMAVQIDDTERHHADERLKQMAHFDVLTGLPNRSLYEERLNQTLLLAKRNKFNFAVMFLDLDKFKNVNDTIGHQVGDMLLKEVSQRLLSHVRKSDTVGRMGGDEFQILLSEVSRPDDAAVVADKIIQSIREPFFLNGHECRIGVSIGISIYPDDGDTMVTLTKNADLAMYHVKEHGRNRYEFFNPAMDEALQEKTKMEAALRVALEQDEFELLYQPQIDIKSGKLVGCEALIRWNHPEMGVISPVKFIPLAEETMLVVPIGEWVLRQACNQNRLWQKQGFHMERISVNLSALQFKDDMFVEKISAILKETGLEPHCLDVEITESGLMRNVDLSIETMDKLRGIGVKISVDDFGTGYSSLLYLKRFPIDILKIDQDFIRNCTTDASDAVITSTIISMAHRLKIKVIAEGVDDEGQLELLRVFSCDEVQGYIFSKPVSAADFDKLLIDNHVF